MQKVILTLAINNKVNKFLFVSFFRSESLRQCTGTGTCPGPGTECLQKQLQLKFGLHVSHDPCTLYSCACTQRVQGTGKKIVFMSGVGGFVGLWVCGFVGWPADGQHEEKK